MCFKTVPVHDAAGIFLPGAKVTPVSSKLDVPIWVRWIGQDRNGAWWGFEHEPNEGAVSWYKNEVGRYLKLLQAQPNAAWRNTLCKVRD